MTTAVAGRLLLTVTSLDPNFLSDAAELEARATGSRFTIARRRFINLRLTMKTILQLFVFTRAQPGFPQSSPEKNDLTWW